MAKTMRSRSARWRFSERHPAAAQLGQRSAELNSVARRAAQICERQSWEVQFSKKCWARDSAANRLRLARGAIQTAVRRMRSEQLVRATLAQPEQNAA